MSWGVSMLLLCLLLLPNKGPGLTFTMFPASKPAAGRGVLIVVKARYYISMCIFPLRPFLDLFLYVSFYYRLISSSCLSYYFLPFFFFLFKFYIESSTLTNRQPLKYLGEE